MREVFPQTQGQAAGIQTNVEAQVRAQRGDTVNDASLFWAMVINNALVALGLPIIGGLWWYKRRQMLSGQACRTESVPLSACLPVRGIQTDAAKVGLSER